MEVYVGVASLEWDVIDEEFGQKDNLYIMCFLVDPDDKTIYRRSSIKSTKDQFVDVILSQSTKVERFVYDTMPAEWEKGLADAGVKLYPGVKGSSLKAATDIFD